MILCAVNGIRNILMYNHFSKALILLALTFSTVHVSGAYVPIGKIDVDASQSFETPFISFFFQIFVSLAVVDLANISRFHILHPLLISILGIQLFNYFVSRYACGFCLVISSSINIHNFPFLALIVDPYC